MEDNFVIGIVKWYGGYNSKTGVENNFGFINAMTGEDIFFHKNSIKSDHNPFDNDIVIFELMTRKGKLTATNVHIIKFEFEYLTSFASLLRKSKELYPNFFSNYVVCSSLEDLLNSEVINNLSTKDFIELLQGISSSDKYTFSKINDFVTTNGCSEPIKEILLNIVDKIEYSKILNSNNISYYLQIEKIKKMLIDKISSDIDELSNKEKCIAVEFNLADLDDLIYDLSFLDNAISNSNKEIRIRLLNEIKSRIIAADSFNMIENLNKSYYLWESIFVSISDKDFINELLKRSLPLKY